mgnify:CR=1 FL=1
MRRLFELTPRKLAGRCPVTCDPTVQIEVRIPDRTATGPPRYDAATTRPGPNRDTSARTYPYAWSR